MQRGPWSHSARTNRTVELAAACATAVACVVILAPVFEPSAEAASPAAGEAALVETTYRGPAASILAGHARVTDGDGLRIGEVRIRLHGIDAFERGQICGRSPCGEASRRNLMALTEGRRVECEPLDQDRYGRTVARCLVAGLDLGEAQVEAGHALAYRRYALDYVAAEEAARRDRRGAWAGDFETPEDWRRARRG